MKRLFAFALLIAVLCTFLCACGKSDSITAVVDSKYDDGYAVRFAKSTTTDSNGNKVYEFESEQYDKYIDEHGRVLSSDIMKDIASQHKETYGEFAYIDDAKKAVIVGVHEDQYDEKVAKAESASIVDYAFKYFQSLQTPVDAIKVIYCEANNQEIVYGTCDYSIE